MFLVWLEEVFLTMDGLNLSILLLNVLQIKKKNVLLKFIILEFLSPWIFS